MASESGLSLKTVIGLLKEAQSRDWFQYEGDEGPWKKVDFQCKLQWEALGKVFEIGAGEFLEFAKQDLDEDSEKGRVNALSNAKRAIGCRVDEVLKLSYHSYSERKKWHLPVKMKRLQHLGVPALGVLERLVNKPRNLLEHEYNRPTGQEEIQDVVEIAQLFLEATDQYVKRGYIASATVQCTEWFPDEEPWDRRCHALVGYRDRYELIFDLEKEEVTLKYFRIGECYRRWRPRRKEWEEWDSEDVEKKQTGIPIRTCDMEDVRELMTLLRQKGAW